MPKKGFVNKQRAMLEEQVRVNHPVMHVSKLFPSLRTKVWGLRAGAHQEEAAGGSLLGADLPHRRSLEEAAAHRPQHVLSSRPGAHQPRQDQILTGRYAGVCQTW